MQSINIDLSGFENTQKLNAYLGLCDKKSIPEPLLFKELDPLGTSLVPAVTVESQTKTEYQMRFLGAQSSQLNSSQDRILALKHLTNAVHILLSRSMILNILSVLCMSNSSCDLTKSLETIGLSDVRKIVRLMTLTATGRVEINDVKVDGDVIVHSPLLLMKGFSQLTSTLPAATSSCLTYLSMSIAALSQNDQEVSKLIVNICTKDLIASAIGLTDGLQVMSQSSVSSIAVTQALVSILSTYGGNSLLESPKEEAISPINSSNQSVGPLSLVNALSSCILSTRIKSQYRQWASQQVFKCIATKIQNTTNPPADTVNLADLFRTIPQCPCTDIEGLENRVSSVAWNDKNLLLASSGCEGTVRIWCQANKSQPYMEHILLFQDMYGSDFQEKAIHHLKWNSSGKYIAAVMESLVNIWAINLQMAEQHIEQEWYIVEQTAYITSTAWAKVETGDDVYHLLIGKINGSVALVTVSNNEKVSEELDHCSKSYGK